MGKVLLLPLGPSLAQEAQECSRVTLGYAETFPAAPLITSFRCSVILRKY